MVVVVTFCLNIIENKYNFQGMQYINYCACLFLSHFKDRGELLCLFYYYFKQH